MFILYSISRIYLDYFVTYFISKTDTKLTAKTFNISSLDILFDLELFYASSQDFDLTSIYLEVSRGKYNYNVLKRRGSRVTLVVFKINVLFCRDL